MTDAPPPAAVSHQQAPSPSCRADARRHSVYAEAESQAQEYKWLQSESAGRDLGEGALRQWAREHWRPFVRACWLEHLRGARYWSEVDRGDFGLIAGAEKALLAEVVAMLRDGGENLDVILWAREAGAPMTEVLRILEALDVNSRRLPHRLDL